MAFEWISEFACAACEEHDRENTVEYDALGYPQCPNCGARTGPLAGVEAARATESAALD